MGIRCRRLFLHITILEQGDLSDINSDERLCTKAVADKWVLNVVSVPALVAAMAVHRAHGLSGLDEVDKFADGFCTAVVTAVSKAFALSRSWVDKPVPFLHTAPSNAVLRFQYGPNKTPKNTHISFRERAQKALTACSGSSYHSRSSTKALCLTDRCHRKCVRV